MSLRRIIAGWSEERGAIAPFAAIVLAVMIGLVALSTDLGSWFAQRRDLQAATDAAALAAVANQGNLNARNVGAIKTQAALMLAENGRRYDASNIDALTLGTYCADKGLEPFDRFRSAIALCPGDTRDASYVVANAVKVETKKDASGFLSKVLQPTPASFQIKTSATAARIDEAGFEAGTGLATVDTQQSALLNAILGDLLGTSVALTAVQYEGLLNTHIDALSFLDALATEVDLSAGTYDQLLDADIGVSQILQAMVGVLQRQGELTEVAVNALQALVSLQGKITGNPQLQIGDLIDLGVWQKQPIGGSTTPTALQAGINLYQLLSLSLQVADGNHAISIPEFKFSLLGLAADVSLEATVIEPPQSPPFAFGPVGVSVHTSQVRLKLSVKLLTGLLEALLGPVLQLPLYVEAGAGDATLTDINCQPRTDRESDIVTIHAESGIVRVYLGKMMSMDAMNNTSRPINYDTDVQRAPILDVGLMQILTLVRVDARAKVEVGRGSDDLGFKYTDIEDRVKKSVSSENAIGTLLDSLTTLDLDACVLGAVGLCIIPLAGKDLAKLLEGIHSLLDPVVDKLLDPLINNLLVALGVKLGTIDVTVTGVRCGVPVLVQ